MVAIDADSRDIRRTIEKLVSISTDAGAEFSRDIVVRCKNDSLSVASKGGEGKFFMRLPRLSLPRFDQFQFAQNGNEITLAGWSEDAPPEHFQIVDTLMELYNLCGKVAQHRRTSAWLFLAEQPDLVTHIAQGRDDSVVQALVERVAHGDPDLALDTFLLTRLVGIENILYLMPVAELVNHSALAQPFYFPPRDKGGGVAVRRTRFPKRFGDECFASYGKLDSLDSWLIYNFVEEHADFVRSVPVEVKLPGVGVIRVHAHIAHRGHPSLPADLEDLRAYLPPVLEKTKDSIDISFILIPAVRSQTLRRVLRWVVDQLTPGNSQADSLAAEAESQILDKNWAYYEALRKRLQGTALKNPVKKPVLDSLNNLCALQLARLIEYGK